MEFLIEYGVFLAKAITIVVAIIVVIGALANLGNKNKKSTEGHIEITNVSEDLEEVKDGMLEELLSEDDYKALQKEKKKEEKAKEKAEKQRLKELKKQEKQSKGSKEIEKADDASSEDSSAEENDSLDSDDDQSKEQDKQQDKGRLFVINFDGDVEASAVENLREEITAVISAADSCDSVLIR